MRNMPRPLLVRLRRRHSPSLELIGRCPRCAKGNRYAGPFESLAGGPQQPPLTQEAIRRALDEMRRPAGPGGRELHGQQGAQS